ncbi:MAG: (deoxy)nucleoside triphosphate pyrophosphohydrolase, partial [Balneolaceae bacterium]|nr:(deoxy)nucleoside triphosphate pyrophosphohydrolase [Balneolaceae bacterium]
PDHKVLIALRPNDAMLGGLWEFPGGKKKEDESIKETVVRELNEELGIEAKIMEPLMKLKHAYSHFKITLHAYICKIEKGTPQPKTSQQIRWISIDELDQVPFPKANRRLTNKLMSNDFHPKELNF